MAKLSVEQALLRAETHLRKGELDGARALYDAVLASFPKNVRAQKGLARLNAAKSDASTNQVPPKEKIDALIAFYSAGRFHELVAQAKAIIGDYPSSFVVWNILAAGQKALGHLAEAEGGFRKAAELNPSYAEAYNNIGVAQKEQGKLDEAIASYQKALKIRPDFAEAYNNTGVVLKDQGKLDEAIASYLRALKIKPDYAEAYNNMGNALKDQGKLDEAIVSYQRALKIKPDYAEPSYNIGNALQGQGKLDEAIASYQRALKIKPDYAEAYNNMGNALKDEGKLDEAIASCHKALKIKPDFAEAYNNMGNALKDKGKLDEAIASYQKALKIKPDYAEPSYNIGNALQGQGKLDEAIASYQRALKIKPDYAEAYNNMGNALSDQGKLDEAIISYQRALKIKPDYAESSYSIGNALQGQGKLDEAIVSYQRALKIKPDYVEAYNNMGNALKDQGKLDEAIASYQNALKIKPDFAEAYSNMGLVLKDQGKLDEAVAAYERALSLKPDYAEAYNNLGHAHLMEFDFTTGFPMYEWRWKADPKIGKALVTSKPRWKGEEGKTVLLWAEQGIGDEIMFSSMIPELEMICSRLIVTCDQRLIPIFKKSFSPKISFHSKKMTISENEYDFQIPFGSVPEILRPNLDSFEESSKPFLKCQKNRSEELRNLLRKDGAKKVVGISWHSESRVHHKSVSLERLAESISNAGTEIVNLQYGDVSEQLLGLQKSTGIKIKEICEIDNRNDIEGLADLIAACDRVVSVSNVTVHLAGALGIDTKVLLPFSPDWRWGLKQSNSYWYRSLKLYRQKHPNDWEDVFINLRKDFGNS